MPLPVIYDVLNRTANFTCESQGQPLSSCLWARTLKGQLEATVVDGDGEYAPTDGIHFFFADEPNSGTCGVNIESVTEDHIGKWACALVADDGEVLTGEVELYSGKKLCEA